MKSEKEKGKDYKIRYGKVRIEGKWRKWEDIEEELRRKGIRVQIKNKFKGDVSSESSGEEGTKNK